MRGIAASGERWRYFIEAYALMIASALVIRLVAFRRVVRLGSRPLGSRAADPALAMHRLVMVRRMVAAAARRSPLRALCFEQGLTAQVMLRRRGISSTLFYGVAFGSDAAKPLEAHVWVRAEGIDICGCENASGYKVLMRWPAE